MSDITTNYVKFLKGTPGAYEALAVKDPNTLYFIVAADQKVGKIYMGEILVAGNVTSDGSSILDTLGELADVNLTGAEAKDLLGFNGEYWVPMTIAEALGDSNLIADTQIFEVEIEAGADHVVAITTKVGENPLKNGDIAIVKELINGDKRQYTSYVYDGTWKAMDGNYNAENVYFDEDITITMQVGNATVTNGAGTIASKGKNIKQVFETLYAKEDLTLTVDWPSVSLSLDTSSVDKEVGDTFSRPTATLKVSDIGSYEYGSLDSTGAEKAKSTTGITFNKMKVGFGTDETITDTNKYTEISAGNYGVNQTIAYTAKEADIADLTVTDAGASYKFFATCDHTASPYKPRTNLGNLITTGSWKDNNKTQLNGTASGDISNFDSALGQITAKTLTPSDVTFTMTGYRKWFTYVGNNTDTIDSAWIRENCTDKGKGKNINQNTLNLSVAGGTKRVVIAVPSGKLTGTDTTISNYTARVKSCIDVDGMGLDIFAAGKIPSSTIAVNDKAGANPMDYVVYVYENSNGLAATTLKFTIN